MKQSKHHLGCVAADCAEVKGNVGYFSPEGINLFGEPEERLVGTPSDMRTVGHCLMLEVLVGEPAFMDRQMICKPYEQQAAHIMQRQRPWVCYIAGSLLVVLSRLSPYVALVFTAMTDLLKCA